MLGERLQYVLLPGERLQDEAAEDPLTAALGNRMADCELYWRAKLQRPLQEVFATCLSHAALQVILPARSRLVILWQRSKSYLETSPTACRL